MEQYENGRHLSALCKAHIVVLQLQPTTNRACCLVSPALGPLVACARERTSSVARRRCPLCPHAVFIFTRWQTTAPVPTEVSKIQTDHVAFHHGKVRQSRARESHQQRITPSLPLVSACRINFHTMTNYCPGTNRSQ